MDVWQKPSSKTIIVLLNNYPPIKRSKWIEVTRSCPTLWNPVDCSQPASSFHGILQARILEWVAISFSKIKQPPQNSRPNMGAGSVLSMCILLTPALNITNCMHSLNLISQRHRKLDYPWPFHCSVISRFIGERIYNATTF